MYEIPFAYSTVQGDGNRDEQNFPLVPENEVLGSIGRECNICGYTAESLNQYLEHINEHKPVCHLCNESFHTVNSLMVHKKNVHDECTKFKCEKCSETFISQTEASTHNTDCCSDAFNEVFCNKILTTQEHITHDLNSNGEDDLRDSNNILTIIESSDFISHNEKLKNIYNNHKIEPISTSALYVSNNPYIDNLNIVKEDSGKDLDFLDVDTENSSIQKEKDHKDVTNSNSQIHINNEYQFVSNEAIENSSDTIIQSSRDYSVIVERINFYNEDEEMNKSVSRSKKEVSITEDKIDQQNEVGRPAALKTLISQKKFFCDICSKGYVSKGVLTKHKKYVHATKKVACNICNKLYKNQHTLKSHVKYDHLNRKICNICGKHYTNSDHMKIHDPNRPIVAVCELCGKGFRNHHKFLCHKETHSEGRPYVCTICNASFKTKKTLQIHCYKHREPQFECHLCEKRFPLRCELKSHLRKHLECCEVKDNEYKKSFMPLSIRRKFPCNVCGKLFVSNPVLQRHVESVHSMKKVACKLCKKSFTCERLLKFHMARNHGNKEICDICGKTYTNVTSHLKTHNKSIEAICEICGKGFISHAGFSFHMKSAHTEERPHVCTICNASFKTKHCLRNHCNRHLEASFECNLCGRKFNEKNRLKIHLRTHTGEEPFSCSDCGATFKWHSSVKHHKTKCTKVIRD